MPTKKQLEVIEDIAISVTMSAITGIIPPAAAKLEITEWQEHCRFEYSDNNEPTDTDEMGCACRAGYPTPSAACTACKYAVGLIRL